MTPIPDSLVRRLSEYLSLHMGLRFPPERYSDLRRGISSATAEFGFTDEEECVRWLMKAPLSKYQVEILAGHLTIGETYFFRDPKMFETLEREVLPPLISARRESGRHLRLWSAGCATGEEPYSLAILLSRLLPDMEKWNLTILGTDINPSFLRRAAEGVYREWSFRSVPQQVKERYFIPVGTRRYRITPTLQECVTFGYLNLADDLYPSLLNRTNAMDIILCRNVLMYFSTEQQSEVVRKFHRALVPHGLLVVSAAEMTADIFTGFTDLKLSGSAFYRRIDIAETRPASAPPKPHKVVDPAGAVPPRPSTATKASLPAQADLLREAEELYLQGRYEDAAQKLRGMVHANDAEVRAIELMARTQANLGHLDTAREMCEMAIRRNKLDPGLHILLATILQEMGLTEEQDAALKRALYLDHDLVLANFTRGNIALRRQSRREAQRYFESALASLAKMERDEIVPYSEGITVGRMQEIIMTAIKGKAAI